MQTSLLCYVPQNLPFTIYSTMLYNAIYTILYNTIQYYSILFNPIQSYSILEYYHFLINILFKSFLSFHLLSSFILLLFSPAFPKLSPFLASFYSLEATCLLCSLTLQSPISVYPASPLATFSPHLQTPPVPPSALHHNTGPTKH